VLKLAGGTAGGQVITVAAAPILTRLYGPESFGVLATFASILVLLNVMSSLNDKLAIAVPVDDDEAVALAWLCFGLVAIFRALSVLQMRWLSGALGTMAVKMLTYPKDTEGSITLPGETGTIKIGGAALNQSEHWTFADKSDDDAMVEQASYETTSGYGLGHPPYYQNMPANS